MDNKVQLILGLVLILTGCNHSNENQTNYSKKVIKGNGFVEAFFINDSIIEGEASYYDEMGQLERKTMFKKGKKEGVALEYYSNGQVRDSVNYCYDLKNGPHYVFDSLKKFVYQDYYFFGKLIGGKTRFKNGFVDNFTFSNFENTTLFYCTYDSIGSINRFGGEVINAYPFSSKLNGFQAIGVFSYLIYPPTVNVTYSLGITNEKNGDQKEIMSLDRETPFIDTVLPSLNHNWNYYISANYNDSLNKFHKYFMTVLKLRDE